MGRLKLLLHGPELVSLMREARSLALLEHPAIVTIFEVDEGTVRCGERSIPCGWIAMQLVDGETLDGWVKRGRPRAAAVVEVIVAIGRALAHIHAKGLLHRDLKPTNIMVDGRGRPFLIDFGLAIAPLMTSAHLERGAAAVDALGERATLAGAVRGTPSYMAPEAIEGRPSAASDQFSLAVLAWEALFGGHPWRTNGQGAEAPGLARVEPWQRERLEPVLARGMERMASHRFPSVDAFCSALVAAVSRRWQGVAAGVGVAVALVGVVGVGGAYWAGWLGEPSTPAAAAITPMPSERPAGTACSGLEAWTGHWSIMGRSSGPSTRTSSSRCDRSA